MIQDQQPDGVLMRPVLNLNVNSGDSSGQQKVQRMQTQASTQPTSPTMVTTTNTNIPSLCSSDPAALADFSSEKMEVVPANDQSQPSPAIQQKVNLAEQNVDSTTYNKSDTAAAAGLGQPSKPLQSRLQAQDNNNNDFEQLAKNRVAFDLSLIHI